MSGDQAQSAAVPERNLALELVRATEAAAMAAARWVGTEDFAQDICEYPKT